MDNIAVSRKVTAMDLATGKIYGRSFPDPSTNVRVDAFDPSQVSRVITEKLVTTYIERANVTRTLKKMQRKRQRKMQLRYLKAW
jgi:hypothetical protein